MSVTFLFVGFDEERIYRTKVATPDELLARILQLPLPAHKET